MSRSGDALASVFIATTPAGRFDGAAFFLDGRLPVAVNLSFDPTINILRKPPHRAADGDWSGKAQIRRRIRHKRIDARAPKSRQAFNFTAAQQPRTQHWVGSAGCVGRNLQIGLPSVVVQNST